MVPYYTSSVHSQLSGLLKIPFGKNLFKWWWEKEASISYVDGILRIFDPHPGLLCWQVYKIRLCSSVDIWATPSVPLVVNIVYECPRRISSQDLRRFVCVKCHPLIWKSYTDGEGNLHIFLNVLIANAWVTFIVLQYQKS